MEVTFSSITNLCWFGALYTQGQLDQASGLSDMQNSPAETSLWKVFQDNRGMATVILVHSCIYPDRDNDLCCWFLDG